MSEQMPSSEGHRDQFSYKTIRSLFGEERLQARVAEMKELYAQEFPDDGLFIPAEQDWEMLAILHDHDADTGKHSVDTYKIARDKINRPLRLSSNTDDVFPLTFRQMFAEENVPVDRFLRACLLHDIGKLAMPPALLTNHIHDDICAEILFAHEADLAEPIRRALELKTTDPLPQDAKSLLDALDAKGLRPQSILPIKFLLAEEDVEQMRDVLHQLQIKAHGTLRHLTIDDSLLTVLRTHEAYSERMLKSAGLSLEAILAGSHHSRTRQPQEKIENGVSYKIALGTLQVTINIADLIHLSDVTEALLSERSYKGAMTPLATLAKLVEHAERGLVDPFVTYLWVADDMVRYEEKNLPETEADVEQKKKIETFLEANVTTYNHI